MGALALIGAMLGIVAILAILSLTTMALVELIQGRLGLRGRNLLRVLEQMVGQDAAGRLMNSAYLRSLTDPRNPGRMPSFLPASAVADAILEQATGTAGSRRDWRDRLAESGPAALAAAPVTARDVLLSFLRDAQNQDDLHRRVQAWFSDINDRSIGWYRRRLQKIVVLVALTLATLINADTFQMLSRLTQDAALRAAAIEQAQQLIQTRMTPALSPAQMAEVAVELCPPMAGHNAQRFTQVALVNCIAGYPAPFLGWADDPLFRGLAGDYAMTPAEWLGLALHKLIGLIVTAAAVSFGASLLFDRLKPLVHARQSTLSPRSSSAAAPAAAHPAAIISTPSSATPAASAAASVSTEGRGTQDAEYRMVHGLRGFAPEALDMDLVNADWLASLSALAYHTHESSFDAFMARAQLQHEFFDGGATVAIAATAPVGRSTIGVRTVDTNGFVAWNDDDCFIVFCGEQDEYPDWFLDARLRRIDQILDEQALRVHEGLHAALTAVWRPGFSGALPELLARFDSGRRRIWLTGHGLGGALAQMTAIVLEQALSRPGNRYAQSWAGIRGVYSFGAPRIGDESFVSALQDRCSRRVFRFVNGRDLLPRTPPTAAGYRHAGQLYYFDGLGHLKADAPEWLLTQGLQDNCIDQLRELAPSRVDDHGIGQYRRRLHSALRRNGLTPGTDPVF